MSPGDAAAPAGQVRGEASDQMAADQGQDNPNTASHAITSLAPDVLAFFGKLGTLGVPVFTAPRSDDTGKEYRRPNGWQTFGAAGNVDRLLDLTAGGALCALCGGVLAVVDVDPRNGGSIDDVRLLLGAIGVKVFAEVATPGGGRHFYVAGHPELASTHSGSGGRIAGFPGVDVQSFGTNVFLPGTRRPKYDGRGYEIVFEDLDALADGGDPDGAEALAAWVAEHRERPAAETFEPADAWDGTPPDRRQAAYLDKALHNQAAEVAATASGGRNAALHIAAVKLGNYVAGAGLDEALVIDKLTAAAEACGLTRDDGAAQTRATIFSGLRFGKTRPRAVPDAPIPLGQVQPVHKEPLAVATGIDVWTQVLELLDHLATWQEGDDVGPTLFVLAVAVAAVDTRGEPLWGMMVGPPSSGKTENVRMLDNVADDRTDELSAAGMLSWSKGKTPRPVGILTRIPDPALVTVGDFSTVLAGSDRNAKDQLFSALRRVYDGALTRDLGNAGAPLRWAGRLAILAAVTPAIDAYTAHADALGPRWLYLRMTELDPDRRRKAAARRVTDLAGKRRTAREITARIVAAGRAAVAAVDLTDEALEALADAAVVCCHARGDVPRDGYGRREILGMATVEEPHRLVAQLQALARAAVAIGAPEHLAVALARRAALDTVPRARAAALRALSGGEVRSMRGTARAAHMAPTVAMRALEDLRELGLTTCTEDLLASEEHTAAPTTARDWHLTEKLGMTAGAVVDAADQLHRLFTKKGGHPPNPPKIKGQDDENDADGTVTRGHTPRFVNSSALNGQASAAEMTVSP